MITYRLSDAQMRTIKVDRLCICVALPLPFRGVYHALDYASYHLAVLRSWIKSTAPATIAVEWAIGQQGTAARLGRIVPNPMERQRDMAMRRLEVLLVVLGLPDEPMPAILRGVHWPADVDQK